MLGVEDIVTGVQGSYLSKDLLERMIQLRFAGRKTTLKKTADAFGISVPNLRGILKTGTIGTNSRRKIAVAWRKWKVTQGGGGSGLGKADGQEKAGIDFKEYLPGQITTDLFRKMVRTLTGIDKKVLDNHEAKQIGDMFFDGTYGNEMVRNLYSGVYGLLKYETDQIAKAWNKWVNSGASKPKPATTPMPGVPAAPKPKPPKFGSGPTVEKPQMKIYRKTDITVPLFRGMIIALLGDGYKLDPEMPNNTLEKITKTFYMLADDVQKIADSGEIGHMDKVSIVTRWNRHVVENKKVDVALKKYGYADIYSGLFRAMAEKRTGIRVTESTPTSQIYKVADVFGLYTSDVSEALQRATPYLPPHVAKSIAIEWNKWIDLGSPSMTKEERVALLNRHVGGNEGLSKKDYDEIQALAKQIGQDKYRKSVFRGIKLKGIYQTKIVDIMANRSVKLSTLEGGKRYAESWSIDPRKAIQFAESFGPDRPFVVMEARPAPKDIIISMDEKFLDKIKDVSAIKKGSIESYASQEKEVVVRTGNRKYTLCKNIRYLNIPRDHLRAGGGGHDINILIPIVQRLKDKRNLARFQSDLAKDFGRYRFACGGGNIVYLASDRNAETWHRKLASR